MTETIYLPSLCHAAMSAVPAAVVHFGRHVEMILANTTLSTDTIGRGCFVRNKKYVLSGEDKQAHGGQYKCSPRD